MYAENVLRVRDDPVVEYPLGEYVVLAQAIQPAKAPRLAHADMASAGHEIGALIAGHARVEEADDLRNLAAGEQFGARQIALVGAIHADDVGAVDAGRARLESLEQNHMAARREDFALGDIALHLLFQIGMRAERRIDRARVIHAGHHEFERHGLHESVQIAPLLIRHARKAGQIAVAGGIDEHFGVNADAAGFPVKHRRFHPIAVLFHVDQLRVQQHFHAGLLEQLGIQALERLRTEHAAPLPFFGRAIAHRLPDVARGAAAPHVEQPAGAHAAEESALFGDERPCALAGCADRRRNAARPAAHDQHVGIQFHKRHPPVACDFTQPYCKRPTFKCQQR